MGPGYVRTRGISGTNLTIPPRIGYTVRLRLGVGPGADNALAPHAAASTNGARRPVSGRGKDGNHGESKREQTTGYS